MTFRQAYIATALPIALVATLTLHGVTREIDPDGATPTLFIIHFTAACLIAAGITYGIIRINRNRP